MFSFNLKENSLSFFIILGGGVSTGAYEMQLNCFPAVAKGKIWAHYLDRHEDSQTSFTKYECYRVFTYFVSDIKR